MDAPETPAKKFLTPQDLEELPHVYANGFQVSATNSDVNIVWKIGNKPTEVLHLSYTTAKTLRDKVGDIVARFEKAVGREMLVTDEVDKAMKKAATGAIKPAPENKEQPKEKRRRNVAKH